MAVRIEFTQKPRFAQSARAREIQTTIAKPGGLSSGAVNVEFSPTALIKAGKEKQKVTSSMFKQFSSELRSVEREMQAIKERMDAVPELSEQYLALAKERTALGARYKELTSSEEGESPNSKFREYLEAAVSTMAKGGVPPRAEGIRLFGTDGYEFLVRGGVAAAEQLLGVFKELDSYNNGSLGEEDGLDRLDATLSQLETLFTGDILAEPAEVSSVVENTSRETKVGILIEQLDFSSASEVALGLRSARSEDLIKAAVSGLDSSMINQLIIKPSEDEAQSGSPRTLKREGIIELSAQSVE